MMSRSEDAPKVFEAAETTAPATGTAFTVESADLVDHCWVFAGLLSGAMMLDEFATSVMKQDESA